MRTRLAALVLLAAAACSGGGHPVVHAEPDRVVKAPVSVVGGRWLAMDQGTAPGDWRPLTSTDGRRWAPARLAGLDDDLFVDFPSTVGTLAAVVAKGVYRGPDLGGPLPPAYAWVTDDGERWQGGLVTEHLWAGVTVVDAGGLVLAGAADDGRFRLWRLAVDRWVPTEVDVTVPTRTQATLRDAWRQDDGWRALLDRSGEGGARSWTMLASPDGTRWREVACPGACGHEVRAGGLHVRPGESSFDGRAWQPTTATGLPVQYLADLVAVPGGWLATTPSDFDGGFEARLLASSDGRTWRDLDVGSCGAHEVRSLGPLAVDHGRAYVTRGCGDELRSRGSVLLEVEGNEVRALHRWPGLVGDLRARGGRVAVPVLEPDGRLRSLDFVRL